MIAEYFGSRLQEYDIKIYATDIDEEALALARRGEYSLHAVKHIRPEWREKYFRGTKSLRVNREIRRLVIFGCSNLGQDAPISHVSLLVCRNLLIYFDSDLQKQILRRLTYALEPGGILFLGKAESQLSNSAHVRRLNPRWRIFQRSAGSYQLNERPDARQEALESAMTNPARSAQQADSLRQSQKHLLETLRVGVLALENDDLISQHNAAALTRCGLAPANLRGRSWPRPTCPCVFPNCSRSWRPRE